MGSKLEVVEKLETETETENESEDSETECDVRLYTLSVDPGVRSLAAVLIRDGEIIFKATEDILGCEWKCFKRKLRERWFDELSRRVTQFVLTILCEYVFPLKKNIFLQVIVEQNDVKYTRHFPGMVASCLLTAEMLQLKRNFRQPLIRIVRPTDVAHKFKLGGIKRKEKKLRTRQLVKTEPDFTEHENDCLLNALYCGVSFRLPLPSSGHRNSP